MLIGHGKPIEGPIPEANVAARRVSFSPIHDIAEPTISGSHSGCLGWGTCLLWHGKNPSQGLKPSEDKNIHCQLNIAMTSWHSTKQLPASPKA